MTHIILEEKIDEKFLNVEEIKKLSDQYKKILLEK